MHLADLLLLPLVDWIGLDCTVDNNNNKSSRARYNKNKDIQANTAFLYALLLLTKKVKSNREKVK